MRTWLLAPAIACCLGVAAAATVAPIPTFAVPPPVQSIDVEAPITNTAGGRVFLTSAHSKAAARADLLPAGARSILNIRGRLKHGEFVWDDEGVPPGPIKVHVDLRRQIVSVFRGPHEIGSAVTLYGIGNHETPLGVYPIIAKIEDHWSSTYDAAMPYTLRLTHDGIAVHGSEVRRARATHGCVGVPLQFARLLFREASVGDAVEIVSSHELAP
jgi:hypothetical protein